MLVLCVFFFFFKQKTAYDMRISDWSSDVCSSDLDHRRQYVTRTTARTSQGASRSVHEGRNTYVRDSKGQGVVHRSGERRFGARAWLCNVGRGADHHHTGSGSRSEEHTSELQSLMRISYAVFCLKKKIPKDTYATQIIQE